MFLILEVEMSNKYSLFVIIFSILAFHCFQLSAQNLISNLELSGQISNENISIPSTHINNELSSNPKCILFDNLDPYHFSAYYQYIQASEYSEMFTRVSFTDDFFKTNYITDFEVIIFPMGNYLLNAKTPGGIKVIDKILEAYNAGKRVMITSNLGMVGAFWTQIGNDPTVQNFFNNILGVDYIGYRPTCDSAISGSSLTVTFRQFVARGAIQDPVSWAAIKHCNAVFNGQTPLNPFCYNVDVFKLKSNSTFKPVDHFVLDDTQPLKDTLLGVRSDKKDGGKLIYWSMGFEYMSTTYSRQFAVTSAINWLLMKAPAPGPKLEFIPNEINFGSLDIGQTTSAEFLALNSGEGVLKVDNVEFSFGNSAFQIEGGIPKTPFEIKSNATKSFKVIFKPTENYNYIDYLDFTTNDAENQIKGIALKGRGGTGIGPLLKLNHNQVNFGSVGVLKQKFVDIEMLNAGNRELTINWISIENNEKKAFSFVFGSAVPVILQPNQSKTVRIKFVPQVVGEVYNAILKILSTSLDESEKYILMTGYGIEPGTGPKIELSSEEIDFGYVQPNDPLGGKNESLTVYNLGESELEISSINFENNTDIAFSLANEYLFPIKLEMGNSYIFEINFLPKNDVHYNSYMVILSNAENEPEKKVFLKGAGTLSGIKDFANFSDSYELKIYQSRFTGRLIVDYISKNGHINKLSLKLYDATGNFVSTMLTDFDCNQSMRFEFNYPNIANGAYFIRGIIGNDVINASFVYS